MRVDFFFFFSSDEKQISIFPKMLDSSFKEHELVFFMYPVKKIMLSCSAAVCKSEESVITPPYLDLCRASSSGSCTVERERLVKDSLMR